MMFFFISKKKMVSKLVFVQVSVAPYRTIFWSENFIMFLLYYYIYFTSSGVWLTANQNTTHLIFSSSWAPSLSLLLLKQNGEECGNGGAQTRRGKQEEDAAAGSDAGNSGGPAVCFYFSFCKHRLFLSSSTTSLLLSLSLFHYSHA